jgi:nitrate/TMAO reductase-like tetraheme cytochrome c subunit
MTGNPAKYVKLVPASVVRVFCRLSWPGRILVVLVGIGVFSVAAVEVTGQPGFCNSCHIMNPYYDSWTKSSHAEVNCLNCHLQPGLTGYVKGKINGLAQLVDCVVGRVSTKPSATIVDASCLRSKCHAADKLTTETFSCTGIRFTHDKHINKVVDGIHTTCGTCHNHFEGNAHFGVDRNTCFTCHFLRNDATGRRPVKTNCRGCHEVPDQVIRRGYVKIDHHEFVSYKANCEESCHKREVQQVSRVEKTVCLDCHAFPMEADANSIELHTIHTSGPKVECFACHRMVSHGQTQVESVSAMMNCQSCHSNTHQVQQTIYSTQHPVQPNGTDRVLSPMFMTHVECTGCHIEPTAKTPGTLDSFGTVARAVPAACDKCHESGTGAKYVPFWQETIKKLYEQVERKVKESEASVAADTNAEGAQELARRVQQARSILDSIRFDGSWGVHNFKYTEALLLEADKMVSRGG